MDHATCHVVYVDKRAYMDRYEERSGPRASLPPTILPESMGGFGLEPEEVQLNLRNLLTVFPGVHVFTSGTSCMAKLRDLNESIENDLVPTFVILDVPMASDLDDQPPERAPFERSTPSPTSQPVSPEGWALSPLANAEEFYSLLLLQHIVAEISYSNLSKLVLPIAMTHSRENGPHAQHTVASGHPPRSDSSKPRLFAGQSNATDRDLLGPSAPVDPKRMMRCLEAGAVDVLTSPLRSDRIYGLTIHAYRAHKEASKDQAAFLATKRLRKRSWVGLDEEQPYGYLRESMVSTLMTSICKPESVLHSLDQRDLYTLSHRQEAVVAKAIGSWNFSAHDFSEDELVHASFLMLQHALDMPELKPWRIPADDLKYFLMACRAAYNGFVLYHNFRHVVDVLQASFYFLLQLGTLPPYSSPAAASETVKVVSPIAALLKPFDALTLLIAAIGHDVGHPGVNNAFLVALKAPLAQLYNDNSVLEAFHCAAYSQILRRYWSTAFEDTNLRRLLIKSILATDMGVHFKYMADLGNLQEKLHHNKGTDGWNDKALDEYRTLACGLLIKCADISNVARPFKVAAKWSDILQLEFAKQGEMEKDVGIPTTLFGGPPELGNITKLANSQIGFMNIFASPLFESVADILPGMQFAVNEIRANQKVWKTKIEEEQVKQDPKLERLRHTEGFRSPRSGSPGRFMTSQSELSHPEGLPASGSSPALPTDIPMSTSSPVLNLESRRASPGSPPALLAENRSPPASLGHSRHSSLTQQLDPSGSTHETMSLSRRSSGAFPGANILPPALSTKRSSNTVPSQLQLNLVGSSTSSNVSVGVMAPDNARYPLRASTDDLPSSGVSSVGVAGQVDESGRHGSLSESASSNSGGGGSGAFRKHRGDKGDQDANPIHPFSPPHQHFSRPVSNRHSTVPSSGCYSTYSAGRDRRSNATSGAFTFSSHVLPSSPTETQATSFLTDGSDVGVNDTASPLSPELLHIERPGSGHKSLATPFAKGDVEKANEVKTSVAGITNHAPLKGEKEIRRKGSRFRLDFWKRKGREVGF